MKQILTRRQGCLRGLTAVLCAIVISPGSALANIPSRSLLMAQAAATVDDTRIPPDQLDSLVAPIALYPDPLLAQVLAASTYPLEIMQLQQWLEHNPGLKDKALADAVEKQPWDPSVQAMAPLPDVVKWLANDIQWTTDLGNAFLAQQSDVMNAVQRMRSKAEDKGTLKSTEQQVVRTETIQDKSVIVIEQANPDVVYVPAYEPQVVYGAPVYPYPAISYPSWGYYAAGAAMSWGLGVAMGAAWGGGWGWGAGWGGNNININRNNFYNRNSVNALNRNGGSWQHNPTHRGGTPYSNRATANRFGGTARGDSLASRQAGARQQIGRQGGNVRSNGVGTGGVGNRGGVGGVGGVGGAGRPGGVGGVGGAGRPGGVGGVGGAGRPGGVGGVGGAGRPGGVGGPGGVGTGGVGNRGGLGSAPGGSINRPGGGGIGGADRAGGRDFSPNRGSQGAFGGGSGGFNGGAARRDSSRGASSFGSRGGGGGGGFSRGGGGGGRSRGGGGSRGGGRR
jgi:hypothetical protein